MARMLSAWNNTDRLRCPHCRSIKLRKMGFASQGKQRYFCKHCGKTTVAPRGGKK